MHTRLIRPLLIVVVAFFISPVARAQSEMGKLLDLKGIVLDKSGNPVVGATIMIKNSTKGTSAQADGSFHIQAAPGDTLVVGCIGFKPIKLVHPGKPMIKLVLQEDLANLEQVTVVGYGNIKKKNITGSIASISAKEIATSSAISFDNAIIGKAAGVDVLSSSGVPGSATAITIRGISSLNSDGNQPLIVVDGIPVYGSGAALNTKTFNPSTSALIGFGGTTVSDNLTPRNDFEANPLGNLNPADIESIEILKDAYATSIYGSRGAAGVVLITTKKGSERNAVFNFRYLSGVASPVGTYDLLNGQQYNQVYAAFYNELGLPASFTSPSNTDWVEEISRKAVLNSADMSLSGGSGKMRYFLSGSYTDQPAYVIHNDYKRYTGRMNFSYIASDKFSAGTNISIAYTDNSALNAASIYRQAILKAPNLPVTDANGNYLYTKGTNSYGSMDSNPVADAELNTNYLESSQTLANVFLQYQLFSVLTLRSEFGTDLNTGNAYTRRVKRPSGLGDDAVQSNSNNKKIVTNNTATFVYSDQNKHSINAVLGQSFEKSVESSGSIGGYGFFNDNILSIGSATNRYIQSALKQEWALVSFFSRVNYAYQNRYLAGLTYRVDGSSKFSQNRRYVGFPSASVGWRLSEEPFLAKSSWVDELKLRGSVGFSGNNSPASYYGNQGQYIISSNAMTYAGTSVLTMQQPDNPNLKWERTRSFDMGIDAVFAHDRVSVTLDYYSRRIKDMILSSAIPLYQGWSIQPQNIGDMKNSGVELALSYSPVQKPDFDWGFRLNLSRNVNKLLKLNFDGEEVGQANEAYKYMKEGEPVAQFYLYDWKGIDIYTGDPLWGNGQGGVSSTPPGSLFAQVDDVNQFRQLFGSSAPKAFGGFGNTVRYKNLELDAFCSFSLGGKMINGSRATLLTYATEDASNLSTEILNYWQVAGQDTPVPRLANKSITASAGSAGGVRDFTTSRTTSRFLENAGYLRLRTINLSYQVDPLFLKRVSHNTLRNLQVFIRGTNLLTWTSYTGVDPEVNAFGSSAIRSGYDELTMPQNKMYQLGVSMSL